MRSLIVLVALFGYTAAFGFGGGGGGCGCGAPPPPPCPPPPCPPPCPPPPPPCPPPCPPPPPPCPPPPCPPPAPSCSCGRKKREAPLLVNHLTDKKCNDDELQTLLGENLNENDPSGSLRQIEKLLREKSKDFVVFCDSKPMPFASDADDYCTKEVKGVFCTVFRFR